MTTNEATTVKAEAEKPWHAAYPAPKATAPGIKRETILSWMKEGRFPAGDIVLVDLRRTDYEGGTIRGSINLPAQSLYHTIPALYSLFWSAGVKTVIWYCGSSRGRGNRAAGWFADYIKDQSDSIMQSYTLEEGIKGWTAAGEEYVDMIDGYDATVWK